MNINEEPPHQQTYIIHQPVDLFVLTPVEIFPPLHLHTIIPCCKACSFGFPELKKKNQEADASSVSQPQLHYKSLLIKYYQE